MIINNPKGFVAARNEATDQLHHILKTSRNHPNPEDGKVIRMVCTRAILALQVATSIEQIADIFEKAQAELNPPKQSNAAA